MAAATSTVHYENTAKIVRESQMPTRRRKDVAKKFADWFEYDNPKRFKRDKFLAACEPRPPK